jgi:hypothetical protein
MRLLGKIIPSPVPNPDVIPFVHLKKSAARLNTFPVHLFCAGYTR